MGVAQDNVRARVRARAVRCARTDERCGAAPKGVTRLPEAEKWTRRPAEEGGRGNELCSSACGDVMCGAEDIKCWMGDEQFVLEDEKQDWRGGR